MVEGPIKKTIPLPEGVRVAGKPDLFDLYRKGRGTGDKWIAYVQALQTMKATETLQLDLTNVGDTKKHVRAVVAGIRYTAKLMGVHKPIKYALINNMLHVTL